MILVFDLVLNNNLERVLHKAAQKVRPCVTAVAALTRLEKICFPVVVHTVSMSDDVFDRKL